MAPPHPGWAQRPSVPLAGGMLAGASLAAGAEAGAAAMPQVEQ
jgi:hypothetical protein